MKKVLVVDDEPSIVTLLTFNLEKEGYEVQTADNGQTALDLALTDQFDFILLDLMLPKMDGMEVTRQLRRAQIETPIMMLTAKDDTIDRIVGIELGADDYLTKPFSPREVLARMKAIQRRIQPQQSEKIVNGAITLMPKTKQVIVNQQFIILTKKEYNLLFYFMTHLDQPIDRQTLLEEVWGTHFLGESRQVDIHVSHLRDKIEEDPKKPRYLKTVRGIGYQMVTIDE